MKSHYVVPDCTSCGRAVRIGVDGPEHVDPSSHVNQIHVPTMPGSWQEPDIHKSHYGAQAVQGACNATVPGECPSNRGMVVDADRCLMGWCPAHRNPASDVTEAEWNAKVAEVDRYYQEKFSKGAS